MRSGRWVARGTMVAVVVLCDVVAASEPELVTPEQAGLAARNASLAATLIPITAGLAITPLVPGPGIALLTAGTLVGPAIGFARGGLPGRAILGIAARGIGAGLIVMSATSSNRIDPEPLSTATSRDATNHQWHSTAMLAGTALFVLGFTVDLGTVRKAVQRDAERRITWTPAVQPGRDGIEVAVRATF